CQNCNSMMKPDPDSGTAQNPCYFDATEWDGVSFWARLGPGQSGITALATVGDPNTTDVAGNMVPLNDPICGNPPCMTGRGTRAPTCLANAQPPCLCDPFGQAVQLFDYWEFYKIPFSVMRQKGYGRPEPAIDLKHVISFKLSFGKGDWD